MTTWKALEGLGRPVPREPAPSMTKRRWKRRRVDPYEKSFVKREKKRKKKAQRLAKKALPVTLSVKEITELLLRKKWVSREDFFRAHDAYLASEKWGVFRARIIARCDGFCQYCFKKAKPLHVHHLTYERWGFEEEGDVVALCVNCHDEIHA